MARKTGVKSLELKYTSIAIAGKPGAGRSTLHNNLKPYLIPLGWEVFSGGEFGRQIAIKLGKHNEEDVWHHKATVYGDDIDNQIDIEMRNKLSNPQNHVLVESWISGWNMRGLKHVLKVLLMCDDALRIDRIVNRDNLTVAEAKKHLKDRETANLTKWKKLYKTSDFWNPKHYDLVINTYSHGPQETLRIVLEALGYFNHHQLKAKR